ncbi:CBS domain-containing protein [Archangium sp.]|uniref:CBS domain-containing protein n=1 Tax=Archangium sp. TaxID=1872627 RepID=UPI002D63E6E8|nr:CBS domain-containing protein [Archangium sp.]HYO55938.1 CBS domain-containing protein [Archangium sp.]
MTRRTVEPQVVAMSDVILYPRDTVMRALEVMHRYSVHLLPVVEERHGEILGHVTEEELHRIGSTLPLARMSEILTARAHITSEGSAGERPRLFVVPGGQGSRSTWLH